MKKFLNSPQGLVFALVVGVALGNAVGEIAAVVLYYELIAPGLESVRQWYPQ